MSGRCDPCRVDVRSAVTQHLVNLLKSDSMECVDYPPVGGHEFIGRVPGHSQQYVEIADKVKPRKRMFLGQRVDDRELVGDNAARGEEAGQRAVRCLRLSRWARIWGSGRCARILLKKSVLLAT